METTETRTRASVKTEGKAGNDLARAAVFFLSLAILVLGTDRLAALALDKWLAHGPGEPLNRFLADPVTPRLTMLGTSKVMNELVPDAFGASVYNLGRAGHYLGYQSALVSLMEQRGRLSPVILLHLDQGVFFEFPERDHLLSDRRKMKVFYGKVAWVTEYFDALPIPERAKLVFHLYRFNDGFLKRIRNHWQAPARDSLHGFTPLIASPGDAEKVRHDLQAKGKMRFEPGRLNRYPLRFLDHIIEVCERNGVILICYTGTHFPHRPAFYRPVHDLLDSVMAGRGIPYFDYLASGAPDTLADIGFWKDYTHLNSRGAAIFSRLLAARVDSVVQSRALRPVAGK